ncbi:T9SS sorting signal type C domain-containing protein [Flavobacterium foetidum]|uniref:T9SS sorting signal type C domain-containing protein n=1 Tax=Flavobacterium foetidum TaxID=2026681 RepID=UPI001075027F|nr:T9SS sorting signal type C domain-containing protein [Flavobacterium foetidum]KAF2514539.1 T9SS sorting signal type C domain-containing protein [Flavobacterium foetidum]
MKKTLLLFLLLPFFGFAQALNGTYTINSGNAAPFNTLQNAIARINSVGVSGPVVFLLNQNQTITSTLTINQFSGTSSTNRLTIRPASGSNVVISGAVAGPMITFNGADNIIIDGNDSTTDNRLRIYNTYNASPETTKAGIALNSNADNNIIRNLTIQLNVVDTTKDVYTIGVFAGGNSFGSTGVNSNNTVSKVTFTNVSQAVFVDGSNNNNTINWTISENTIGSTTDANKPSLGIYLSNVNGYTIDKNLISGIRKNSNYNSRTASGITIVGSSSGTISNNKISDIANNIYNNGSSTAGIFIDNNTSTTIYNNIISNVYNTTTDNNDYNYHNKGQGVYIKSGSGYNIYHNTIVMNYANASAYSSCLYLEGGSNYDIRNNIFYNSQSTGTQYSFFSAVGVTTLNYNCHYVTNNASNFNAKISGQATTSFANWKTNTGKDANSVNSAPVFLSDFHLNTTSAANNSLAGQLISTVTTDIDGEARVKPYMGADEVVACTPTGDQNTFGTNSWIGYVYNWTGANPNPANPNTVPVSSTSTYIGTVTENALFDRNIGNGAVNGVTRTINCDTPPSDNFFVRYKMRTTTAAGIYNFTIGGDDGVRLYIDGTLVNVAPANSYTGHGYNSYAAQVTLSAGQHDFVLEYFEMGGASRVSFSYGIISTVLGASNPPGIDKWNVYGYTLANLDLPAYSYAGSYVDNNLNIATTAFWNRAVSPYSATGWSGAPVPVDNFTISYKRKGFPCGRYRIVVANCDDNLRIYHNGTLIYTAGGNINNNTAAVNNTTYDLGADSEIEVRLQEDAGDALMNVNFIPSTAPGDAANAPTASATKQPSCADNTGTITVTDPASGTGFTYSIDGTSYTNTSGVFTNLTAGSYNVTVKNTSTGCISPATVITITPPAGKVWNGSTSTSWNTPSNWTPSGVPTATDCVEIPNVAVKPLLAASTGTYYAYSLTVNDQASLTVGSNNTMQVTNAVTVLGTGQLVFENNSSLIQTTNATNNGYITYKRNTQPVRRYDFTYWSTPVTGADNTLHNLSPNTLLDKYYSYDAAGQKWVIKNYGNVNMEYGVGYIVRAPQSYSTTVPAVYTGSFIGTPNNGPYTIHPVSGNWNLIGNPYPSALDAEEWIDVNHLAGTDIGALYFWTHNSPPSSAVSGNATNNYTSNDYAVFSLTGSVATTSGAASPNGYIAAGQGFFIQPAGNSIVFNNSMRVGGNNAQFFKTAKTSKIEKNRLWLNFTNAQGAFKQALIGYVENATNGMDTNYDALTMAGNSYIDFYSINDKDLLTIQARALPFDKADIVPLGYKTTVAGNFTIGIDHTDGFFAEQAVYLEDKKTGTIHDLRTADYTFTTTVGTFADRFALRYTSKTLGTGDFENIEESILIAVKDKTVSITSTKENIKDVLIYNIGGQEVYNKKKVTATELQISNLQVSEQVLLAKVTLENGHIVTKKIIFR